MSVCWPLVSVGVLQRDCVTLHYSTSNSDALSSVSRACARNTQNYIRPQALVDKISYISRLSIQNMFAAIQDFQKCYLYFVVCYNYEWCLLAVNAAINMFRQTVGNLCLSLAPNILQHYLLTKTGFKSKCWFYYWKIFNFKNFFTTKELYFHPGKAWGKSEHICQEQVIAASWEYFVSLAGHFHYQFTDLLTLI